MPAPRPQLLDDLPVQDDLVLWPGLKFLAVQLAELLPRLPVTSPILVSGDWGSGKTTLLLAVQRQLSLGPGAPALWFDAWRHEGGGPLLPALMRRVWESTPEDFRATDKARGMFRTLFSTALSFGLRLAPAVAAWSGVPLPAGLSGALSLGALKDDGGALGPARSAEPPVDPTAALWEGFSNLVKAAWPDKEPVIFIDDLDRCSPTGAVALLDDLRMLVSGASDLGCKFVVAMDRGVLVGAIASKFKDLSGYDGNRYLEKVFPIAFTLPAPQGRDVARLVASFLAPSEGMLVNAEHQDALSAALNDPTFANPRLMKRCINRFRLVVAFEASTAPPRSASEIAAADRTLAKWIAATERFPLLRRLLVAHHEKFWEELEAALARPGAALPSPDAERLVSEEGALPWVRREIFGGGAQKLAQLREAEGRLRRWGL